MFGGREVNLGRVKGRPVIDANGDNVGTIEDVVIDPTSWKVSGFLVHLKREVAQRFNVHSGFLESPRVEVGSDRVRTIGDNVILNIEMDVIGETLRRREPEDAGPAGPMGGVYDPVTGTSGATMPGPTLGNEPIEPPRY